MLTLSETANGGQRRGELLLCEEEAEQVNSMIAAQGFCFFQVPTAKRENPLDESKRRLKRDMPAVIDSQRKKRKHIPDDMESEQSFHSVRASRRRRDPLPGRWQDSAVLVMDSLMAFKQAKQFYEPFESEGVENPIGLLDVSERLSNDKYPHVWRWQLDVRSVLFNVLDNHSNTEEIFELAAAVVRYFESLCMDYEGANPYAIFAIMQHLKPEARHLDPPPQRAPRKRPEPKSKDVSDLIRRVANGNLALAEKIPALSKQNVQESRPSERRLEVKSALPPPPPAPLQSEYNQEKHDLKKNISQRLQQFVQLDIAYRMAALSLIEKELGIDGHSSAFDVTFTPQLDLLPSYMQKQYLCYIKKLHTAQTKFRDTLGVPITTANAARAESSDDEVDQQPTDVSAVGTLVWPGSRQSVVTTNYGLPSREVLEEHDTRVDTSSASEESSSDYSDEELDRVKKGRSLGFLAEPTNHLDMLAPEQGSMAWGEWKSKVIHQQVMAGLKATSTAEQEDATI